MKTFYSTLITLMVCGGAFGQVGINTDDPDSSSALDIAGDDVGVLMPRVELVNVLQGDPVSEPAHGLIVFNIANTGDGDTDVSTGLYYWDDIKLRWYKITAGETGNHYVGELYGGGVVFYVYENGQHGLIASLDDLGDPSWGGQWGPDYASTTDKSWWDGATNTATAAGAGAGATTAIGLCDAYSSTVDGVTYDDWHLPSIGELKALEDAAYVLFKVLDQDGDPTTNAPDYDSDYWASTADGTREAYSFSFDNTHTNVEDRGSWFKIRAVRSF